MTQEGASGPGPKSRRRWLGLFARVALFACAAVVVAALCAGLLAYLVYEHITQPGTPGEPVAVTIPAGATGAGTGRVLADAGLIEHPALLRVAIRLDASGQSIKHGRYRIPQGLSPMEVLKTLQDGPDPRLAMEDLPPEQRVTVPEGLTITQMAERFDDPEAFLEAARDSGHLRRIGVDAETLEGFLLPNTYFFDARPTEAEVVARMVDQFLREYEALLDEYPHAADRDKLEVVTVASLVEKESRADEERPLVAAVVYNRLERNMPLEMDATLQYANNSWGERVLYAHKEVDSPYNTYRNRGLPPGPIANPGRASLAAAMDPADADYLFFVSNADGRTHTFSRTLGEHVRAVNRYRREVAEQRRELRRRQQQD